MNFCYFFNNCKRKYFVFIDKLFGVRLFLLFLNIILRFLKVFCWYYIIIIKIKDCDLIKK